jgi:serine/threonine protein kinase/tetratricopeptide (TPR) repeat protein
MGTVYAAEQIEPIRRKVAIKVIRPGMDSGHVIARFEAERQALAMMDHPNIARVLDAGETGDGRLYFAMDLVSGEPITEYCDRHTLATEDRLGLFVPVCQAVQHAHRRGIIHRDLKPSNILVATTDGKPIPVVIDFGIAKATTVPLTDRTLLTRHGQLIGTPAYMSPEQAEAGPLGVDTRSDIYSLGVILYELLAGRPPFEPEVWRTASPADVQRILRDQEPPLPSTSLSTPSGDSKTIARRRRTEPGTLVRQLKGELDWIVSKAMDKDPGRRYETANDLALDITRHLRDEPVEARPPSTAYRIRKYIKRNSIVITVATTVLATLLGALIYSNAQRTRAQDAHDESKAVTGFLADMLASVDPGERGREVTVRRILDEASAGIGEEFAARPRIEARLRSTIGRSYTALGAYEQGESNQRRALELQRALLGEQHPETLRSKYDLAHTVKWRGSYREADSLFRETLEVQRRVLGDDHPETLDTRDGLAGLLERQSRYEEARAIYAENLEVRLRRLGEQDASTLLNMNSLAWVHWRMGHYSKAESLASRALDLSRQNFGEEHPYTAECRDTLANVYFRQGRLEESGRLHRENLAARRKAFGDEHPKTLYSMHNLAYACVKQGRYEEAEALLREGLATFKRVMGSDHVQTWVFANSLAWAAREQGHYAEAESLYRWTLDGKREVFGNDHRSTLSTLFDFACLLAVQGRREEALDALRQTVEGGYLKAGRMERHPYLEPLRDDPAFQALVEEARRREMAASERANRERTGDVLERH